MQAKIIFSSFREAALLIAILAILTTLTSGCASQASRPSALPSGDNTPVTLRDLQITQSEGHRAVFIRLSRLPTLIQHSNSGDPARIMIIAWGPTGGEDLGERGAQSTGPLHRSSQGIAGKWRTSYYS